MIDRIRDFLDSLKPGKMSVITYLFEGGHWEQIGRYGFEKPSLQRERGDNAEKVVVAVKALWFKERLIPKLLKFFRLKDSWYPTYELIDTHYLGEWPDEDPNEMSVFPL